MEIKDEIIETTEIQENIEINDEKQVPVIALRGLCVFPDTNPQINLGRAVSINAFKVAEEKNLTVFFPVQKDTRQDKVEKQDLYEIGAIGKITNHSDRDEKGISIFVEATKRAKLVTLEDGVFYTSKIVEIEEDDEYSLERETALNTAKEYFEKCVKQIADLPQRLFQNVRQETSYNKFCNIVTYYLIKDFEENKKILFELDTFERLQLVIKNLYTLAKEIEINNEIMEKVRDAVNQNQKEFFLREQMKAISEELKDNVSEAESYRKKLEEIKIDAKSTAKISKEIERLEKTVPQSPEFSMLTNYLDWVFDLPYNKMSEDKNDIKEVEKILNSEHYGLESVKKRILEYLAVYKFTGSQKAPILCLVGAPGVGKTSVAMGIAKALGKELIRMSLGGVKDESEIRGHRRTYLGSMPGRIIYNMKNAGTINPVFVLDEIDKMTSDFRGDPESALLEVLDPEQNSTFRDNFLEIPYDLSKVMFIATANSLSTISQPLLDRMEIIELDSYTDIEKLHIAKEHLIKKALASNGLENKNIIFTNDAIKYVIDYYTSEAGVRELFRQINSILRKLVKTKLEKNEGFDKKITITAKMVEKLLGTKKYRKEFLYKEDSVGEAIGLAWTSVGGTVLPIESTLISGSGEVVLTGQLGDVMKESAKIAVSYIKSKAKEFNIDEELFTKNDIHIHAPEGAVPKDGPSAGITLATSVLSSLLDKKINHGYSMTGEITLRGRVLPIGGLKEKALASYKNGVKNIIIPQGNEKDIEEIPSAIRKEINFIPVSFVDEVFELVIEK